MHTPDHPKGMPEGEYERIRAKATNLDLTFTEYVEVERELRPARQRLAKKKIRAREVTV